MSLNERNTNYLIKRKVIYRRDPISDVPTKSFDWGVYYEEGTHECYNLFASKAKINTYKSLKWHLYTLLRFRYATKAIYSRANDWQKKIVILRNIRCYDSNKQRKRKYNY